MSYSKGFKKGYAIGVNAGLKLALEKMAYSIEFAGAVRSKQFKIISQEISQQKSLLVSPDITCQYDQPWCGSCGSKNVLDNGQCENHQEKCSCGKLATHGCSYAGQFVCGRPLCDDCKCSH